MTTTTERAPEVNRGGQVVQLQGVRLGWRERFVLRTAWETTKASRDPAISGLAKVLHASDVERGFPAIAVTVAALRRRFGDEVYEKHLRFTPQGRVERRRDMRATRRALRKVRALGLVELLYFGSGHYEAGSLGYKLTGVGARVASTFEHELETGGRIRWAKLAAGASGNAS